MKGMMAVVAVLAMLGASVALAGLASAGQPRSLVPVVETGSTDRLGGGDWISVRAGDARVGVVYGTVGHPNKLYVFAEYKRFLGGADIYDSRGNYLQTRGIPVYVVFGQSFDHLIEFQDTNNDSLFNLYRYGRNDTTAGDQPVKATGLVRAWTATVPSVEPAGNTTYVNFTVGTPDLPYDLVWDGATSLPRRGTPADGALDRLNFTFHLKVDVREVSGEVPWFRVSVSDGTARTISDVLYEGTRNYSGSAVAMGAKYDHLIEGWDFAAPTNLLALETRAFLGRAVHSRRVPLGGDGQRHVPPAGERHDCARPPAPHSRLRILQRRVGPGDGHRGPPRVAERRDGRWARGDDAVPGPGRGAVPRRL